MMNRYGVLFVVGVGDIVYLLASEEENRVGSLLLSEGPWAGVIWCFHEHFHLVPCESSKPVACYLISC